MVKVTEEEVQKMRTLATQAASVVEMYAAAVSIASYELQAINDAKAHLWSQLKKKYLLAPRQKYTFDFEAQEITDFVD